MSQNEWKDINGVEQQGKWNAKNDDNNFVSKENTHERKYLWKCAFNYFNLMRSERKRQQLSTWIFPHRFTVWTKPRSCENIRANEYCTNDPSKARTRLYSFENEREKCEKARKWKERKKTISIKFVRFVAIGSK